MGALGRELRGRGEHDLRHPTLELFWGRLASGEGWQRSKLSTFAHFPKLRGNSADMRELQLFRHVALLSFVTGSEWSPNHSDNSAVESTIRANRCGSLRRRAEFLFGAQFALADAAKLGNFIGVISLTAGALLIPGRAPAVRPRCYVVVLFSFSGSPVGGP